MCVLLGYGADAICPYLVFEMASSLRNEGLLDNTLTDQLLYVVIIKIYINLIFSGKKLLDLDSNPVSQTQCHSFTQYF